MKAKLILAVLAAAATSPALADTPAPQSVLTSSGAGRYEVWCKVTPMSGDEATHYLQPGRDTLPLGKVRRADCNYKATSAGPLTLKLAGSEWNCPFKVAADAACEATFAQASFGSFDLRRKARRALHQR